MNAAHYHLMLNHVPVLATYFSLVVLLWGLIRKNDSYKTVAYVGFVVAAIFSIVAVQTGEGAEEIVEGLSGVSESIIHEHEEAAEGAQWVSIVLGIVALGGLFLKNFSRNIKKYLATVAVVLGFVSAGYMAYTAYEGGQIRHTEIRDQNANQPGVTGTEESEGYEESE